MCKKLSSLKGILACKGYGKSVKKLLKKSFSVKKFTVSGYKPTDYKAKFEFSNSEFDYEEFSQEFNKKPKAHREWDLSPKALELAEYYGLSIYDIERFNRMPIEEVEAMSKEKDAKGVATKKAQKAQVFLYIDRYYI